ncbi:MAG TPA: LysM peptidoglycan-binding domain-containing protein [Mesorhizobium sp.]|jgi:nucleoid-associated protein YgaU|uniref:LysM peptidoglycan-binding domain-containing protein n=1 Tax=Mesorhizobium sp. TaxID=1871066 RepID=UPI002DDDA224|nr:LysM peptidoglycan-binding domain-containing protein [Mesorhizobium sp.]HEV2503352.1 LysM peptidoglycan-binding domain-containing protein [Mesorhizobium sp.]
MTTALVRALLFAGGGAAAVAGVAYISGALDPYLKSTPPAQIAAVQPGAPATQQPAVQQPTTSPQPAEQQAAVTPTPEKPAAPAPAAGPVAPTFDVVRAEGDGSVVVAGKAAPNAKVDVVQGATVFGTTTAGPDGDFAIVLNDPLKPGNYQLQLRSTSPSNAVVPSAQTAVVAIPEKSNGQVLALVEEPGKAATLLSVPKVEDKAGGETSLQQTSAAPAGAQAAPQPTASAAQPAEPVAQPAPGAPKVSVGAVEIDGGKIFVAGTADPGRKVRAYANEILLGEAVASEKGQFLVEATRDLPVGDYTVRVDLLDADGSKVIARAAVPFQREPGEAVAAVAPSASEAAPATPQQDAASADKAPTTVAPKLEQVDHAVIIRRGDSLWRISRRVYGHGVRYSTIYLANQQQISNPDRIWPGQVFKVPQKSKEGETADMKTLGDQATVAE